MEKNKYIYGASIQGIQGFIFSTNSLKDVVGGSELVEKVCTTLFESTYEQGGTSIIKAAGNIKCVYDNLQECEKTVLEFPKTVMLAAPGITISQAVVKVTEEEFKANFASCMDQLEKKLKIQRNKPSKSMTVGFMGVERSRTTGLPAVTQESQEYLDEGTLKKRNLSIGGKATITLAEKSFGIKELSPKNIALALRTSLERMTGLPLSMQMVMVWDKSCPSSAVPQKNLSVFQQTSIRLPARQLMQPSRKYIPLKTTDKIQASSLSAL